MSRVLDRYLTKLSSMFVPCHHALGVDSATFGSLLAPVLMKRIPQEIALIVSREGKEVSWNLDDLLKIIEREIQARERTTQDANGTARRSNREPATATALLTDNSVPALRCFCNKPHASQACRTVYLQLSNRSSVYDVQGDALYAYTTIAVQHFKHLSTLD